MAKDHQTEGKDKDALPLHQFLTYRLSRVQAKLNAQATRLLQREFGITLSQWRVIALVGAAGSTRLSDLAQQAAMDKGLLSRNIKVLIKDGLVQSKENDTDQRVHHLSLTPAGQDLFARVLPVTRTRQSKLRADISDDELQVFRRVLDKLEIAAEQ